MRIDRRRLPQDGGLLPEGEPLYQPADASRPRPTLASRLASFAEQEPVNNLLRSAAYEEKLRDTLDGTSRSAVRARKVSQALEGYWSDTADFSSKPNPQPRALGSARWVSEFKAASAPRQSVPVLNPKGGDDLTASGSPNVVVDFGQLFAPSRAAKGAGSTLAFARFAALRG